MVVHGPGFKSRPGTLLSTVLCLLSDSNEDFTEALGDFRQGFIYISLISPEGSAKLRWAGRGGGAQRPVLRVK
jgi:hypothetical protein